jgi:hypothetical protein
MTKMLREILVILVVIATMTGVAAAQDRGRRTENGRRQASPRVQTSGSSTGSSSSFGTVSDAEKIRKSAADTIKRNDKNGNGMLEPDEQSGLGMSANADQDGDHVITHNELVSFYTPKPIDSTQPTSAGKVSSLSSTADRSDAPRVFGAAAKSLRKQKPGKDKRKSYRFAPGKDRLPAGLPGWFKSRDANGDGQVAMSEYSRSWTDRAAAEFLRYDRDNDGMITAKEAR